MRRGPGPILVAPGSTPWANEMIDKLAKGIQSKRQAIPPLPISWDTGPGNEISRAAETLCNATEHVSCSEVLRRINQLANAPPWISAVINSIEMARRAHGKSIWSQMELFTLCSKRANLHRAYGYLSSYGIRVMTIQAAKNQQFRDVVVLWGPGIPGSADHLRRLLYNAISRAEQNCAVMVRTKWLLGQPPFV